MSFTDNQVSMATATGGSVVFSSPADLIGHSYVRRLQEYMVKQAELHNLGFPHQDAVIKSCTMRFRDDDKWINCHMQPALACHSDIVYRHVGKNDVLHLSAEEIIDHLWAQVQYVRSVAHHRAIILSHLLWFPVYEAQHEKITLVNCRLLDRINDSHRVPGVPPTHTVLLRHQYGIWGPSRRSLFDDEGIHLNSAGL